MREERPHTYRHTSRDDLARLAPATLSRHNPTPGHTKTKRSEPLSIQLEVGPPARPYALPFRYPEPRAVTAVLLAAGWL